jgi:hypothetical protein
VVSPDAPALISVVTLNFLANGGDGYPIKANGENFRYLLEERSARRWTATLSAARCARRGAEGLPAGRDAANVRGDMRLGEQQALKESCLQWPAWCPRD